MAQFLGDIAAMMEIFAVAAGLVLLHRASTEEARLLKAAGIVLVIGGIGAGMCTTWFWLKYNESGAFETTAVCSD